MEDGTPPAQQLAALLHLLHASTSMRWAPPAQVQVQVRSGRLCDLSSWLLSFCTPAPVHEMEDERRIVAISFQLAASDLCFCTPPTRRRRSAEQEME